MSKDHASQVTFDFGPQSGEIWTVFGEIVMVVRIGSEHFSGFLPNCIEYIGIGYARHDGCGRWWDVDYNLPSENIDPYWAPTGTMRCDKVYFNPWDGKGVFHATADGAKAMELIAQWRREKDYDKRGQIESLLKKLFSRKTACEGFR